MLKYLRLQLGDFVHETVPLRSVPLSLRLLVLQEILSQDLLGAGVAAAPLLYPRSGFELSSGRGQPAAGPLVSPSV